MKIGSFTFVDVVVGVVVVIVAGVGGVVVCAGSLSYETYADTLVRMMLGLGIYSVGRAGLAGARAYALKNGVSASQTRSL